MLNNLNTNVLGISCRQSELVELALTYGFHSIDIDLQDVLKRAEKNGLESATRFLTSSKTKIHGFTIPVNLDASEEEFAKQLSSLTKAAEAAAFVGASVGVLGLPSATDRLPYHEYFEVMRKRVADVAKVLAPHSISIGLTFSASKEDREGKQFKFISDVEGFLAFIKLSSAPNVGVVLDTWHWTLGGGTVEQLSGLPVGKIFSVRLADIPADAELENLTQQQRTLPSADGKVNNAEFIAKLRLMGYVGAVTLWPDASAFTVRNRDAVVQVVQERFHDLLSGESGELKSTDPSSPPALAGR